MPKFLVTSKLKENKLDLLPENQLPFLSGKLDSIVIRKESINAGIDRIEGRFTKVTVNELASMSKFLIDTSQKKGLGIVRTYNLLGTPINLCFKTPKDPLPYLFFLNLSHRSLPIMQLYAMIDGFPALALSRITRVDVKADFQMSLNKLLMVTQVKNKQISKEYDSHSLNIKGHSWGTGDQITRLYERSKEADKPITRLEIQFRNKKLPTNRSIKSITGWLLSENLFSHIQLWDILGSSQVSPSPKMTFFSNIKRNFNFINFQLRGLSQAKKSHKAPRNFFRELRKFIKLKKSKISLSEIFRKEITKTTEV